MRPVTTRCPHGAPTAAEAAGVYIPAGCRGVVPSQRQFDLWRWAFAPVNRAFVLSVRGGRYLVSWWPT